MPATRSVVLRPLCVFLPWSRSAAFRRSSTAVLSFSRISSSVATRVASVTAPRGADQLGVEVLRRCERAHHVLAQLVVVHRAFDVGFDVLRCVVDLVLCLGHACWILSPRYLAPDTPGPPAQTGAPGGCAHPRRLRGVERAEGAAPAGQGPSASPSRRPPGWRVERIHARRRPPRATRSSCRFRRSRSSGRTRTALFDRVAGELAVRMKAIAQQTNGTLSGTKTVTAAAFDRIGSR